MVDSHRHCPIALSSRYIHSLPHFPLPRSPCLSCSLFPSFHTRLQFLCSTIRKEPVTKTIPSLPTFMLHTFILYSVLSLSLYLLPSLLPSLATCLQFLYSSRRKEPVTKGTFKNVTKLLVCFIHVLPLPPFSHIITQPHGYYASKDKRTTVLPLFPGALRL